MTKPSRSAARNAFRDLYVPCGLGVNIPEVIVRVYIYLFYFDNTMIASVSFVLAGNLISNFPQLWGDF